jgi:hypothetical protein
MGCDRPLGPAFRFAGRQTEIRTSSNTPEALHIRVVDHLSSVGNLPLRSLEVRIPDDASFGAQNLRMTSEGAEVSAEHSSNVDRRMMRTEFHPAWKSSPREIVTEWDLPSKASGRATIGVSAAGFYIADETALPLWQTPAGILTQGGPVPDTETLTVVTPADYRILAPGKILKRSLDGNLATRRFRIQPDKDFFLYVVAGRYQEQIIRSSQGSVNFWTVQPLDSSAAQTAATRLESSLEALKDYYDPGSKGGNTVHLVEAPGELPDELGEGNPGGGSFPNGALLDSRAIAQGIASEPVLQVAEYELARTWFGWRVRPRPEAQILMGRGIGLFGMVIAAEVHGQEQRERMIASLLTRYDETKRIAPDRKLIEPPVGYSREERISTGYKAALFFAALEDLCGHDALREALRTVVHDLGGDQTGYEELMASAGAVTGRDLADFFRQWLNHPGIPENFRARYGHLSNSQSRDKETGD